MKKITSFILIFVILCNLVLMASASTANTADSSATAINAIIAEHNVQQDIANALNGITSTNVSQDVLDRIDVGCENEDVEVFYTVSNLGSVATTSNTRSATDTGRNLYSVTTAVKGTRGETTEDYVYCWMVMYWIDNWGTSNEIVSVEGGWNGNGRTLSGRQVWFGISDIKGYFFDGQYESHLLDSDTFNITPTKKTCRPITSRIQYCIFRRISLLDLLRCLAYNI